jgi:hypothetical protein
MRPTAYLYPNVEFCGLFLAGALPINRQIILDAGGETHL